MKSIRYPRTVVVSGLGVVSALGVGRRRFWEALTSGVCGVRPVESFPTSGYRSRLGAEIKGFSPKDAFSYALAAAREALSDARVEAGRLEAKRCGVILGTTFGESLGVEGVMQSLGSRAGLAAVAAQAGPFFPGGIPARLARELGFSGPNLMLTTACAAGNSALAAAFEKLQSGAADLILAGGVDLFSERTYAGFSRLLAIAPERCAPFSKDRQGLIPGEGCAVLVLEADESAAARGVEPYARMLGYGLSSDAKHVTAPDVEGVARALALCLEHSGLAPEEVDYISAHGTGTPANDKTETAAIKRVFGAKTPPVSSIKSMLGHAMGAASALEAAASCMTLRTGILPPTINFSPGDPDCDLDYVRDASRRADPVVVLSDAFAFGGSNCVVAFAAPDFEPRLAPERTRRELRLVVTGLAAVERCADPVAAAEEELADLDLRFIDAPTAYALLAARGALADSGLESGVPSDEVGIILDSSGELGSQLKFYNDLRALGPAGVEPRLFPNILANAAASRCAMAFGLRLVNESLAGSFPSGESALARGCELLRRRGRGAILIGGVDDAASIAVLETEEGARARAARIYAEVEVEEEGFLLERAPSPPSCFCLVRALQRVAPGAAPTSYVGRGRWGGTIRLRLTPPA